MKVRALGDRGLPCDVIDVHAACRYYSVIELEQLGLWDEGELDLVDLRDRRTMANSASGMNNPVIPPRTIPPATRPPRPSS